MKSYDKIDFIGIGAAKCATSWVSDILRKHPNVYYPLDEKELCYFNKYIPQDFSTANHLYLKPTSWYHDYFKDAADVQIKGEITPAYLSMENCANDIKSYNPKIKLFAIIRHPVERSFSQYLFSRQNGVGNYKSYREAIEKMPEKFLHTSLYFKNLKRYFDIFPSNQIKVLFYEDIKKDSKSFLKSLYNFLEVPEFFPEDIDKVVNKGKHPKSQALMDIIGKSKLFIYQNGMEKIIPVLRKTGIINGVKYIKAKNLISRGDNNEIIDPDLRKELCHYFEEDIQSLESSLKVNLSHWRK